LEKSNEGLEDKNDATIKFFSGKAAKDEAYQAGLGTANTIKEKADNLYKHIEELKRYLMIRTDKGSFEVPDGLVGATGPADQAGLTKFLMDQSKDTVFTLKKVKVKDNYDVPTYEMLGAIEPMRPADDYYSALNLKGKIEEFKSIILKDFDQAKSPELFNTLNKAFSLEKVESHGVMEEWEIATFNHLPLAAVVTNLSRMQLDILNIEADALNELMAGISGARFEVDQLQARVLPNSNYVMMGDSFAADIFISASSSAIRPEVYLTKDQELINSAFEDVESIDESKYEKLESGVNGGIVTYGVRPGSEGDVSWGGFVKVQQPDGSYKKYGIKPQKYTVAKKSLTVSPTAMNIFYRGLKNPIKVAAPGIATKDLKVSCTNANVSAKNRNNGEYMVKPGKGKTCSCTLSGQVNGKNVVFGKAGFRVKNVPKPEAKFAGVKASGSAPLSKLKAARGVIADMGDFSFQGAKFTIASFTLSTVYKGNPVEAKIVGNKITGKAKPIIGALRSGSKLYVEDIKARGPSGVVSLGGIKIKVR